MQTFYQILGLIGAGLILFILYRTIKGNPGQFSKDNLNKSAYTLGILAVVLIAFIGLLILILRNS